MAKIFSNTYIEPGATTTLSAARQQYNSSLRSILTNFKSNAIPTFTNITVAGETIGEQDGMLFRHDQTGALYISDSIHKKNTPIGGNFTRVGIGARVEESTETLAANAETYEIGELITIVSQNTELSACSTVYLCASNATVAGSLDGFIDIGNLGAVEAAQFLRLRSNAASFTFDSAGDPDPLVQSIDFTVDTFNITDNVVFTTSPEVTLTGTGDVRSLSISDFGTNDSVTVTATANTFTDSITVIKLQDGTDTVSASLTNEAHTLSADFDGSDVQFGGATTEMLIFVGATDDTTNWTFARANSTGVLSTITNNEVTITGMTVDDGYVDITASKSGYSDVTKRFTVTKAKKGNPGIDALEVELSSVATTLTSDPDGVVSSYSGSGTLIYAYEGGVALDYTTDTNVPNSSTWSVVSTTVYTNGTVSTDITVGNIVDGGTYAIVGSHSGMSVSVDSVRIEYELIIKLADGTTQTRTLSQSVAKVKSGDPGLNSATVSLYQKTTTTSAPTDPTGPFTYTFSTGVLSGGTLGSWSQTAPSLAKGEYLWLIQATATSNTATDTIQDSEFSGATIVGIGGEDGAQGDPGLNSATVSLYQKTITTSAPTDPTGPFTYTFSTGVLSGGTLGSWSQTAPSLAKGEYLWLIQATATSNTSTDSIQDSEFSGATIVGIGGEDGDPGLNSATVSLYQKTITTSAPTDPTGPFTYTFSTGVLSGGTLGSWSQTAPSLAKGEYLWLIQATATSNTATDTIQDSEFSGATIVGIGGEDGAQGDPGLNSATVSLYQKTTTTSAPTDPTGPFTYTFSTGVLSGGTLGSWSQTAPSLAKGEYLWLIQATATSNTATDTIQDSEFSGATIVGIGGEDAVSGFLTNEAITVTADADGANPDLTNASTEIKIFLGSVDDTSSWSITTSIPAGITITQTNNLIEVDTLTVNEAYVDITATKTGFDNITKRFTITKAIKGIRGAGRWNIDVDGVTYNNGSGTGTGELPIVSADAQEAWEEGTGYQPSTPSANDQAWFYKGLESAPSEQSVWLYNGTTWNKQEEVIDGNLLVTGTLNADDIQAGTLQADRILTDDITVTGTNKGLGIPVLGIDEINISPGLELNAYSSRLLSSSLGSSPTISASNITAGNKYVIASLGDTNWGSFDATGLAVNGGTYAVRDEIYAFDTGSGSGTCYAGRKELIPGNTLEFIQVYYHDATMHYTVYQNNYGGTWGIFPRQQAYNIDRGLSAEVQPEIMYDDGTLDAEEQAVYDSYNEFLLREPEKGYVVTPYDEALYPSGPPAGTLINYWVHNLKYNPNMTLDKMRSSHRGSQEYANSLQSLTFDYTNGRISDADQEMFSSTLPIQFLGGSSIAEEIITGKEYIIMKTEPGGSLENVGVVNDEYRRGQRFTANNAGTSLSANNQVDNRVSVLANANELIRGNFYMVFDPSDNSRDLSVVQSLGATTGKRNEVFRATKSASRTATVTGATYSGGFGSYTSANHPFYTGETIIVTGMTPSGFNTTGVIVSTTTNTFTIAISDPGFNSSSTGSAASYTSFTITNATYSSGSITYTATGHNFVQGDVITVSGLSPAGYNIRGSVTSATSSTFTIEAPDPGSSLTPGTFEASYSVGIQESSPTGVTFSWDGKKMFVVGASGDDVNYYTLSTAWDLSDTVTFNGSYSVKIQEIAPNGVVFSSDGTKMYIPGADGNDINQYTLSSAWNLAGTVTFNGSRNVSAQDETPRDVAFSTDGTKMFVVGDDGNDINQYTLSTAWNVLGTVTFNGSYSVSSQDTSPLGIAFSSDGKKMFVTGDVGNDISQYGLSTPWTITSGVTFEGSFSVSAQGTNPHGITFSNQGDKFFIVDSSNNSVTQYSTRRSWNLAGTADKYLTDYGYKFLLARLERVALQWAGTGNGGTGINNVTATVTIKGLKR